MKNIGLSNSIEAIYKSKQAYDRSCKIILRNQDILAEILKEFVVEYKGLSRREIIDNYLSRRKEFNLDYDEYEIPSDNIEDDSVDGARVNYDLVYSLIAPTSSGDNIGIIVNIEAQNRYGLKYDIEDRATYYASRLIARQKGPRTVLNVNDYAELKKVYSIWICTNSSKAEQNSILDLRLKPDIRIGNPKIKEVYENIDLSMPTLEKDNNIVDIDPFTIFGTFNKGIKDENRVKIISSIKNIFNQTHHEKASNRSRSHILPCGFCYKQQRPVQGRGFYADLQRPD